MENFTQALREAELFSNLDETQLALISSICELVKFNRHETIFDENSAETDLYIILQGQVETIIDPGLVAETPLKVLPEKAVSTLRRGQNFGEIAFLDQGLRTARAVCQEKNTTLLRIPRSRLLVLCDHYPELGYKVMFNFANDLTHKLRTMGLLLREVLLNSDLEDPHLP